MRVIKKNIIFLSAIFLILIGGSAVGTAVEMSVNSGAYFRADVNETPPDGVICSINFVSAGRLEAVSENSGGFSERNQLFLRFLSSSVETGVDGPEPLEFDIPEMSLGKRTPGIPQVQFPGNELRVRTNEVWIPEDEREFELEGGHVLQLSDFSVNGDKALVKLFKGEEVLEEYILEAGNSYYIASPMPDPVVGDEYAEGSGARDYVVGSGPVVGYKYTLRAGESLDLNDGYLFTLVEVDEYGNKALVSLSKNGYFLDERIVEAGGHYYYNRSYNGENKVIIDLTVRNVFNGYVDSIALFIFEGQYSDAGTVDTDPVIILKLEEELELENAYSLGLEEVGIESESCILTLNRNNIPVDRKVNVEGESYVYRRKDVGSGNIKTVLKIPLSAMFYSDSVQCVELARDYTIFSDENTIDIDPVVLVDSGDSWALGDGYKLEINEVSGNIRAFASLKKNNVVVDQDVLEGESTYQYFRKTSEDGSLRQILDITVNRVFRGNFTNCVEFSPDYTLNSDLNTLALDDRIVLEKLELLELEEGYVLKPEAISFNGGKVLFLLTKDGLYLDEQILPVNKNYYYNRSINGVNRVILTFKLEKTFMGEENRLVIIKDLEQNSDEDLVIEPPIQLVGRESLEIRSPVYSGPDLQAVLDSNGGTLRIDGRNFADFYYDLDNGAVGEKLSILRAGAAREIPEGGLVYRTTIQKTAYAYEGEDWAGEQYDLLGFLGDLFVPLDTSPDKLALLVLDDDEKYILRTGEILDLGYDYGLEVKQIDVEGENVWLEFTKDGEFVDDEIIDTSDSEYSSWVMDLDDIEDEDDVVVFRVHVNDVLMDEEGECFVQVQGLWLIDYANAFTIESDEIFGVLEVDTIGNDFLQLSNFEALSLASASEQLIAGDLKFKVAADDGLRFWLSKAYTSTGIYEVRGEIAEGTAAREWTGLNFAAFQHDPMAGTGPEGLRVNSIDGRKLPGGTVQYVSFPMDTEFEYGAWGSYQAVWFMAEKYLAGYSSGDTGLTAEDADLLSEGNLCRVLLDESVNESLYAGNILPLRDGYSLKVASIDPAGNQISVELEKEGTLLDSRLTGINQAYVYRVAPAGGTQLEVPQIAVHFGDLFNARGRNGVFVKGIFQASDTALEIGEGARFGKMEVNSVSGEGLLMTNPEDVYLDRDSEISLTDNIRFRVADSDTLRFYPFANIKIYFGDYITVDDNQPADFTSIQAAVDNASTGSIILVRPGIYEENVHVDKSLTISSVLDMKESALVLARTRDSVFHIMADNVTIIGLSIENSTDYCGILLDGINGCIVKNSEFSECYCGIGMFVSGGNTISNNGINSNSYGFILAGSGQNTFSGNNISGDEYAVFLKGSSNYNVFSGNTILNNTYGLILYGSDFNELLNNSVKANTYGIYLLDSASNTIFNNAFNNTNNTYFEGINSGNIWNISRTKGPNIAGGPYLGGNFWASPAGNGWSQIHADSNGDGICEPPFQLDENNTDYLPLVSLLGVLPPFADFTVNRSLGVRPMPVEFTDRSLYALNYSWDFGDGNGSTEKNPVHTYSRAGSFTVNLTVSNALGNSSKNDVLIRVQEPIYPVADFTAEPSAGISPLVVRFKDNSTGNVEAWAWDFNGDGLEDSNEISPLWVFRAEGETSPVEYTVELTVKNYNGTARKTALINVSPFIPKPVSSSLFIGDEKAAINDSTGKIVINASENISVSSDNRTLLIRNPGLNLSIYADGAGFNTIGGNLTGNYTGAGLEKTPVNPDLGGNLTRVSVSFNATLSGNLSGILNKSMSLTSTVLPGAPDSFTEKAFQLAGDNFAESIEVAYSLSIEMNWPDELEVRDAYIVMTAPKAYVDARGGPKNFAILSLHEGTVTRLETDYEDFGLYYEFSGYSPEGFSVKALVSYTPFSESPSGPSGNSGGSSGGGGGGSPEPASNVEVKELARKFVSSGNRARFDFTRDVTCVRYVEFDSMRSFGKVTAIVEMLKGKSLLVTGLPAGKVYKNLNIWVGNSGMATPENIGNAAVGFKVEKAWVRENGINESSITLCSYDRKKGGWFALLTSRLDEDEDEDFLYFKADVSPEFASFAITGKGPDVSEKLASETEKKASGGDEDREVELPASEIPGAEQDESRGMPGFGLVSTVLYLLLSLVFLNWRKMEK